MDSIISQIRSLAEAADEAGRHSILDALQLLQSQLETPMDVLMKLYNSVSRNFRGSGKWHSCQRWYTIYSLEPLTNRFTPLVPARSNGRYLRGSPTRLVQAPRRRPFIDHYRCSTRR